MSENLARKPDPRAKRTRDRLGDALIALLVTKPFDDITVQEVLDRAGVSRSTFYEHYRDKNDLFLSDLDEFFEMMSMVLVRRNDLSERVAPVAEFCAHVGEARALYAALVASGRMPDVTELGTAHFARGIEARLADRRRGDGSSTETRAAQAQALAGALMSLLAWWMRQGMSLPPKEVDRLFHALLPGRFPGAQPPGAGRAISS